MLYTYPQNVHKCRQKCLKTNLTKSIMMKGWHALAQLIQDLAISNDFGPLTSANHDSMFDIFSQIGHYYIGFWLPEARNSEVSLT